MEEWAPDKIKVSGRVGMNSAINGIYVKGEDLHEGRVYYKQINGLKTFFIYWCSEETEVIGWRIGDILGESSGFAYNKQNVNDPSQITKAWNIWDGKNHVKDPNVSIRVVQDIEESPEVIKKRKIIENKKKKTAVAKKKEKTANRKLKTDSKMSKSNEKAIEETEKTDPMTLNQQICEILITLDANQLNKPEHRAQNKSVPDEIKVSGRVGHNSGINGIYVKGEDLHEGRVYYKKINGLEKFIYWSENSGSNWWEIGKSLGKSSRFAKNYQNVNDPLQIKKPWYIWDDKKYVKDSNVTIRVVEEEEEDERNSAEFFYQEKDKKIEIKHYETSFTVNDIPTLEERILNQTLGPQSRDYIDLLDQLKQNGLDHEIHAPTCVVIGDQSSGKSSLLENLSGLELPKGCNESTTKAALELELRSPNECEIEGVKVWINPDPSEKVPKDVRNCYIVRSKYIRI